MPDRVFIIMTAGPVLLLLVVLEMVRRRQLREDYSLLWLATAIGMLALALWRDALLGFVSKAMGIFYPPTALFVVAAGFMLLLLLQFSMVITRLARENKQAAQHIALLNQRLRALEAEVEGRSEGAR